MSVEENAADRLYRLRRENNITQEQLADLLGVSRQAVSKWESGVSYPETEKLIKLSKLYRVSVDYLLGGEEPAKTESSETAGNGGGQKNEPRALLDFLLGLHFEYKSKKTLFGLPLVHVNIGFGKNGVSRGIISVGLVSFGLLSVGLLGIGLLSVAVLGIGLFAMGAFSLGLLAALGAITAGIVSVGAVAFGVYSLGAVSIGCFSAGALAIGKYVAVGDHAYGMIAIGKTVASGDIFSALADAAGNFVYSRAEVIRLIDASVPSFLGFFAEMIKPFV